MKNNGHFLTQLEVTPLDDGIHWRLDEPLKFRDKRGDIHCVHKGFVTDFATIPPLAFIAGLFLSFLVPFDVGCAWTHWLRPLLWAAPLTLFALFVVLVSDSFNCDDSGASKLNAPATLHDDGYKRARLGRKWSDVRMKLYWDRLLREACLANGVSPWIAWTVWGAVATFGWLCWHGKKPLTEI